MRRGAQKQRRNHQREAGRLPRLAISLGARRSRLLTTWRQPITNGSARRSSCSRRGSVPSSTARSRRRSRRSGSPPQRCGGSLTDPLIGDKPATEWDVAALLKLMWETWNDVFRAVLGRAERNFVSELRDHRNNWAHQQPFSGDDAYRALDTTNRLLTAVSAPPAADVGHLGPEFLDGTGELDMRLPSGQHPVEQLFDRLKDIDYPDGVCAVPEMISGTGFFPGGSGLWREKPGGPLPPMPLGKIMVLGHNFGKEDDHNKARRVGNELNTPTWKGLLPLLDSVDIRREHCFFTNVYMGLTHGKSNQGQFTGDGTFKRRCESFLGEQIAELKPRLILALGGFVPGPLASRSPDLAPWTECPEDNEGRRQFRDLDAAGPLKHGVHFGELVTTVVALLHPSKRDLNVRLRCYGGGRTGNEAELAMLKEAKAAARLSLRGLRP